MFGFFNFQTFQFETSSFLNFELSRKLKKQEGGYLSCFVGYWCMNSCYDFILKLYFLDFLMIAKLEHIFFQKARVQHFPKSSF